MINFTVVFVSMMILPSVKIELIEFKNVPLYHCSGVSPNDKKYREYFTMTSGVGF
jgi:hypothetical protein